MVIGVASMSAIPTVTQALTDYVGRLRIGQGRYAGERFKLLGWQRRFLSGAFRQPDDAALSMGRGGGKSTFTAAIACAAVDVGGPVPPIYLIRGASRTPTGPPALVMAPSSL